MTLPWFGLLWLVVGLACAGAGLWLTERRTRAARLARECCRACGTPCEPDARFCGVCGCSIQRGARGKHERISPSC